MPKKEDEHKKAYIQEIVEREPIAAMKAGRLELKKRPERSHVTVWFVLLGLAGVSLIAIGGAFFIFCIADSTSTPVLV